MPTTIIFDELVHAHPDGTPREMGEKVIQGQDPMFDMEVKKFKGYALFTQRVRVTDATVPITGRLDYQACDDSKCIFPDPMYFRVILAEARAEFAPLPFTSDAMNVDGGAPAEPVTWTLDIEKKSADHWALKFTATVQDGWYVYSQESFGADGPIPTSIALDSALTHAQLVGEP